MWHSVVPVSGDHDPIVYEASSPANVLVLNAGPGIVKVRAWMTPTGAPPNPALEQELRAGAQAMVGAALVRVKLHLGDFAAVGARVLRS
jgi:hypothetical protein